MLLLAQALHEATEGAPGCMTWLLSPAAQRDLYLQTLISHSEANLMQLGSALRLELHLDRPGSRVSDYDGVVVIDEPDSPLLARARCALPRAETLLSAEYEGHRLTALGLPERDAPRSCDERFAGIDILPLGSGRDRARGSYPGLPRLDGGQCGEIEPVMSAPPPPIDPGAPLPDPPDPAPASPPPPR
jgi:hypothetical protein